MSNAEGISVSAYVQSIIPTYGVQNLGTGPYPVAGIDGGRCVVEVTFAEKLIHRASATEIDTDECTIFKVRHLDRLAVAPGSAEEHASFLKESLYAINQVSRYEVGTNDVKIQIAEQQNRVLWAHAVCIRSTRGHAVVQLRRYLSRLLRRLNQFIESVPKSIFAHKLVEARVIPAEDGFAVFYLGEDSVHWPADVLPQGERTGVPIGLAYGVHFLPESNGSLGQVLQRATGNWVKVYAYPQDRVRGELRVVQAPEVMAENDRVARAGLVIPPDLPPEAAPFNASLNPDVLQNSAYREKFQRICIGPDLRVADGVVTEVEPTYHRILSPLIATESGQLRRQFTWLFLDVLFFPNALSLSPVDGEASAMQAANLLGLMMVDEQSPPATVSVSALRKTVDQLEALINDPGVDEPQVQAFLEQGWNRRLIDWSAEEVYPRRRVGKYIPDFVCKLPEGDYHFVEIEDPKKPIFQEKGQEQSAVLTHAIRQVSDWLRYIRDNTGTVEREDRYDGIYRPTGEVIAGRDRDMKTDEARRSFKHQRAESGIRITTWDTLLTRIRGVLKTLESL